MQAPYTNDYYAALRDGARRSARVLVPLVQRLVSARSVIDVGCGQGTWLSVFRELGVGELRGVDGEHVLVNTEPKMRAWAKPWRVTSSRNSLRCAVSASDGFIAAL